MPCNNDMLHFMQIVDIENSDVLKQRINKESSASFT